MSLYRDRLASLALRVERIDVEGHELDTGNWKRLTTDVRLHGEGHVGRGEDVNYNADEQRAFRAHAPSLELGGRFTLESFSRHLETLDLFPLPPDQPAARDYRRWAFESAALDLALRQAGTSLAEQLDRPLATTRFVASLSLRDSDDVAPLTERRRAHPELEFKVDYGSEWTEATVARLAEVGGVRVVDFKGLYVGAFTGPPGDARMYAAVARGLPDAILEDPSHDDDCLRALDPYGERLSWDAVIHSAEDADTLPRRPRVLNMKPSRFGSLGRLFEAYETFSDRGIALYGGGQFELSVGRSQAIYLAAMFHPDAPNDTAPAIYHRLDRIGDWPRSPLSPQPAATGFDLRPVG